MEQLADILFPGGCQLERLDYCCHLSIQVIGVNALTRIGAVLPAAQVGFFPVIRWEDLLQPLLPHSGWPGVTLGNIAHRLTHKALRRVVFIA